MKKNNVLKAAAFVFATSMAFGVSAAVEANANTVSPFDSLALSDGASVRYNADDGKNGMRFILKMAKSDYQSLASKGYTNVSFGVLIAPEHYHDIYALNEENVFGANAKYCWDGEVSGKAEIFNLTGGMVEDVEDESKMTFYGAVVDILDGDPVGEVNNVALDFRGVGYVTYTYENKVYYKFVGDEDNVRSMAYVAQETSALPGVDATIVQFLKEQYLDKVDWKLKAENAGTQVLDPVATPSITVPESVKALENTFYADKYDISWTFAGTEVAAGASIASPKLTGSYDLVATATRKTNADDKQVVYKKTYQVAPPKLNENALNAFGTLTYDPSTGVYDSREAGIRQFFVDSVTDGDYVATTTITTSFKEGTGINMPGMIIGTSGYDNYITLKGLGGSGRMYITVRTSDANEVFTSTECYIGGNLSGADKLNGITKYTIARVNNTYYIYSYDGSFCCAIDRTGIYPESGRTVSFESGQTMEKMQANLAAFFNKSTKNIVGVYSNAYNANATIGYSHKMEYALGTEAAAKYAIGTAKVNNKAVTNSGTFIYDAAKKQFGVDSTRSDYTSSRNYFLNTISDGDYTVDLNVNVAYREAGKFGHMIGLVIANGVYSRITLSYAPWEANKLVVNVRDENNTAAEITVTGFSFTNATGGVYPFHIARLNNVYYVYNGNNQLGFTISASGLTLQSGFTANTALDTINTKIANVYSIGMQTLIGVSDAKNAATGTYWFDFNMTRGTTAANNKVNPTA